ncbi:MAG: N-acetylneuraminate lyase [Spirochaetales bacterium]|nr:N-acetylneuraminate lyase [Spirochaetales bacterium]
MNTKLTGIYAALFTPFDKDGKIIYDSLQKHVDYLVKQGISGFYVNGSTGESFLMTAEERKKCIEAVVEANAGRATVICHCGAIGTDLSLDLVRHSGRIAGVDAISSVTPFYYKFSKDDIIGYYNDLANATEKPFVVYNIPALSGVSVTPEMMAEMRKNPRIQGLKFTSNDFAALEAIRASDPDLVIYNGYDQMCICGMSIGCDGAIGSTYNVIAPIVLKLWKLTKENKFDKALDVQHTLNSYLRDMTLNGKHFNISKYIISKIEGIDYGIARKPFGPLAKPEIEAAERIIDRLQRKDY